MSKVVNFIQKAKSIHKNKYDYCLVKYKNNHTKVKITCRTHGIFLQAPKDHVSRRTGCPKCGQITSVIKRTNTNQEFIHKANSIHNNKYDYSVVEYKNAHIKIKILCKNHGIFLQTPNSHLNGRGCKKCHNEYLSRIRTGVYNHNFFEEHAEIKNIPSILYLVELQNTNQHLLKIGITTRTIQKRFEGLQTKSKYKGYNIKILNHVNLHLYQAYKLEQHILSKFKHLRQYPTIKFNGYTECMPFSNETSKAINLCLPK